MEQENNYIEEISLRELIEIVLNGKKTIAIITIIAILMSLTVSFFVLPKQYEASTVLITSPISSKEVEINGLKNVTELINQYPEITVETYKQQIKTPQLLEKTIKELDLKNDAAEYISISSLANKIDVSNIKDTNLLTIKVKDIDPEKATIIANTLSENFIDLISDNSRKVSEQAAKIIEEQLKIEEIKINEKSKELAEYIAHSKSVDELKSEVSSIISQLTSFKASLNNIEKNIERDKATLKILLGSNEKVSDIDLNNDIYLNIINDGYESKEIITDISEPNKVKATLLTIEITNLETSLIQNIAEKEALIVKIEELHKELIDTKTILAEEEYKYNKINRDFQLANQAYDVYQQKHKDAILAAAAEIGKSSVIISSYAIVPEYPVSPNKKLNLAISIVLGLMIGVFIVLFKAYWKDSANNESIEARNC